MNKVMKEYRIELGQIGYVVFEMYTDYRAFGRRRKLLIRPKEGGLMNRVKYHEDMKKVFGSEVEFDPYGNVLLKEKLFSMSVDEVQTLVTGMQPWETMNDDEDKVVTRMRRWLEND